MESNKFQLEFGGIQMNEGNNTLKLVGIIKEIDLAYTNEAQGEKFYRLIIEVKRLSEAIDTLPIICSEKLLFDVSHEIGSLVIINGYVRTRNFMDADGHSHLDVFGYATSIKTVISDEEIDTAENNVVRITGYICKPVRCRKTVKTDRSITDLIVAVARPYDRRDYIPCIAWSRNAVLAGNRSVGDKIYIRGRFQSRYYRKKDVPELLTVYEISVMDLQVLEVAEEVASEEEPVVTVEESATVAEEETTTEIVEEAIENESVAEEAEKA